MIKFLLIKVTDHQAILLLINTVVATAILFLPSFLLERAGEDAWISAIFLFFVALVFCLIYSSLINKMGKHDLIFLNRAVFGRIISFIFEINMIFYFVLITGIITREVSELMVGVYFPKTPLWFFNFTLLLTAVVFVNQGLDVIVRTVEIVFYIFLIFFLMSIIFLVKDMSPHFLQPVMGRGIRPVLSGVYPGLLFFSELFLILIIAPYLQNRDRVYRILVISLIIITILFLISIVTILMIFSVDMGARLTFPLLGAFRYSEVWLIERLDPFYIFFWIGGGLLKITVFIYGAVYITGKTFEFLPTKVSIPFIMTGIFYFSHYFFDNVIELFDYLVEIIPYFLLVQIIYPLLLLILANVRGVDFNKE